MSLTRRYLGNTFANLLLKVASSLAGLWAARELVRSLGMAEFGFVTLASALAGYLSFLGLGLPAGLVRQVADLKGRGQEVRLRRLVRLAFFLFCGIGVVGAALVALFDALGGLALLAIPPDTHGAARAAILATAVVLLVSWPLSVFSATLTGLQRIPALNAVQGGAALVSAAVSVWVAKRGAGAGGVVLATGSVLAVSGLAQALLVRRALPPARAEMPRDSHARDELRPLLSFGAWVLALEVASLLIYQTDQVILAVFVSAESLTVYYVAARLHNLVRETNGILSAALFPMIAEEHSRGNPAAAEQAIYRGTRYGVAVIVPATLAAIFLAAPFLRVWMGEGFVPLAPLAQVFVSYWLVASLTTVTGQVALGIGESALLGKIAIAAAIVNLGASLVLVRTWGIAGVIAGTLLAYSLALPAQFVLLFPRLGISRLRFAREVLWPVYSVTIPAGAFWWLVLRWLPEPRSVLSISATGALIVGSCWGGLWFTAVDRRDRERVLSRLPRFRAQPS